MGNEVVIKEKKQIDFIHNKQSYKIYVTISMGFYMHYRKNKDIMSHNQLVKECILKINPQLIDVIDKLHDKQIIYILNVIIKNNDIEFVFIDSLEQFDDFMEVYHQYIKERMREVTKVFNQTYGENINVVIGQMGTMASNLAKVTKRIVETTNNIYTTFQEQYADIIKDTLSRFAEIIKSIDFDKLDEELKGCILIFKEHGYPWLDISTENMFNIIENKDNEDIINIIDEIIIKEYTIERIEKMVDEWTEYDFLEKRIHILKEGIEIFKLEKHYTSIPVFFSQLEGVIAEVCKCNGVMDGKKYKNYINTILNVSDEEELNEEEITKAFIFSNMLEGFMHGGNVPKFSRHAILHGGDTLYGTRVNNINIIILFDFMMCEINKMIETEKEKVMYLK